MWRAACAYVGCVASVASMTRALHVLASGVLLAAVMSCDFGATVEVGSGGAPSVSEPLRDDTPSASEPVRDDVDAVRWLAEVRRAFVWPSADGATERARSLRPFVAPGDVSALELTADARVVARVPEPLRLRARRPASVELPLSADGVVSVRDPATGVTVGVRLVGASRSVLRAAGGTAIFRAALGGADVIYRVTGEGVEDFVVFAERPALARIEYELTVARVPGVRFVADTVELLDEHGAPRLHMRPPVLMDARGAVGPVDVRLEGCAYDTEPRGPWARPLTPPGLGACRVVVDFSRADVVYPAIVDPAWVTTASMSRERYAATATVLADGRVLVAGGLHAMAAPINGCELYDPATDSWAATASLGIARGSHTATVIAAGDVLVVGGDAGDVPASSSTESYDAATGAWSVRASLKKTRNRHAAGLLSNGRVLVVGGHPFDAAPIAELYDPVANAWSEPAPPPFAATGPTDAALVVLGDGRVLVTGGTYFDGAQLAAQTATYLYDPAADTWQSGPSLAGARASHSAHLLANGKVLVVGGYHASLGGATATAELFDPNTNLWSSSGALAAPRGHHAHAVLKDGRLLVAGGLGNAGELASAELYQPSLGTWTTTSAFTLARARHQAALLSNGMVLALGGTANGGHLASAERYTLLALPGQSCSLGAQCLSGYCVDGVCCSAACVAPCAACNLGGSVGACSPIGAGLDPANECLAGACDGAGVCKDDNGQACASPSECLSGNCVDGRCCNTACAALCTACNLAGSVGSCSAIGAGLDPANECLAGACDGAGACKRDNGQLCTLALECLSGNCVDGRCCNTACTATCSACNLAGSAGACTPLGVGLDPANECLAGACDGAGVCKKHVAVACNAAVECLSGSCFDGVCCTTACTGTCVACDLPGKVGACSIIAKDLDPDGECYLGACDGAGVCKSDNGVGCATGSACLGGICVDGRCCSTPCAGVCSACNLSGSAGTCTHIGAGLDPANECVAGACGGAGACKKDLGQTCALGVDCLSGNCVDGRCCNTTCAGTCLACNLQASLGTCAAVPKGADPSSECTGGACDGAGSCKSEDAQACTGPAQCLSAHCYDGACCNVECDDLCQSCAQTGSEGKCLPWAVGTDPDEECAVGACDGAGACTFDPGQGCIAAADCSSGTCVDGVCCASVCGGLCEACNLPGSAGICAPVPHGADPALECPGGACNGQYACALDLGRACIAGGDCLGANCVDGVCCSSECGGTCEACDSVLAPGTCLHVAAGEDPEAECDGVCDGAGACIGGLGHACSSGEDCLSGFCSDGVCCDGECGASEPLDCRACSVAAGATSDGQCAALDAVLCEDGSACTTGDACSAGICRGGAPVVCAAPVACREPGACEPKSGDCVYPASADGALCGSGRCESGDCIEAAVDCSVGSPGRRGGNRGWLLGVVALGLLGRLGVVRGRATARIDRDQGQCSADDGAGRAMSAPHRAAFRAIPRFPRPRNPSSLGSG